MKASVPIDATRAVIGVIGDRIGTPVVKGAYIEYRHNEEREGDSTVRMTSVRDMESNRRPFAVTGVRVVDLFAPFPIGGSLAVCGDPGSGVNVVAMEVMQNLCRRYEATATCYVTVDGTFNEENVRGWVDKLRVGGVVKSIEIAESAHIDVVGVNGLVATLLPFAVDHKSADAWVVTRHTVLASGRLPGVELHESGSKFLADDARKLAERVASEIDRGNDALAQYLGQPFFVAEPWTSKPGVATEREEMLRRISGLLGIDPVISGV